jgi:hypothetical protein
MDAGIERRYTGHSGQMAVMSELLLRGYNVAVPEVDSGEDLLVFRHDQENVARVQVKTARVKKREVKKGYVARFYIPMRQLTERPRNSLWYVLAVRHGGRWTAFLLIRNDQLSDLRVREDMGHVNEKEELVLRVTFRKAQVRCGAVDLRRYRSAWDSLLPGTTGTATPAGEPDAPPASGTTS